MIHITTVIAYKYQRFAIRDGFHSQSSRPPAPAAANKTIYGSNPHPPFIASSVFGHAFKICNRLIPAPCLQEFPSKQHSTAKGAPARNIKLKALRLCFPDCGGKITSLETISARKIFAPSPAQGAQERERTQPSQLQAGIPACSCA